MNTNKIKEEVLKNKGISIIPKDEESMKLFIGKTKDWIDAYLEGYQKAQEEQKKKVEEYIKSLLFRYYNNPDLIHERLDELFLFWTEEYGNFVDACNHFGINYECFNNRRYNLIRNQIKEFLKIKEDEIFGDKNE
jgi:hypothetical protein